MRNKQTTTMYTTLQATW